MIKLTNIKTPLDYDSETLKKLAAERLEVNPERIKEVTIIKRAVNNSNPEDIFFDMILHVSVFGYENELVWGKKSKGVFFAETAFYTISSEKKQLLLRPIVVGCGPAGIFAALTLAKAGARPIVLERGEDVDTRTKKVKLFWNSGVLDTESNVQFGEGGAGAFSDGKLKIGSTDGRKMMILDEFVYAGAPQEITYLDKPHIGTDKLKITVKNLRNKIISLGGEVIFGAKVTEICIKNNTVRAVTFEKNGISREIITDNVVLAIGHSARDTFSALHLKGILMEQKAFAVGVRIEHLQSHINKIEYGRFFDNPYLGAADYRMVVHLKNGRSIYTFCMCPGGTVVAAGSEENGITTNGMSEFARDGRNANTALLVTVNKNDLKNDHPLAGIEFQRQIEKAAFTAGGGGYKAPVQRLEDFIADRQTTTFGEVTPTYLPGTAFNPVSSYLPSFAVESLQEGIKEMCDWKKGYYSPDALLTGAETRSSSPVRILRGEDLQASGICGLYPCGEGAGYAGGIISAAVDGVLCAEKILSN